MSELYVRTCKVVPGKPCDVVGKAIRYSCPLVLMTPLLCDEFIEGPKNLKVQVIQVVRDNWKTITADY